LLTLPGISAALFMASHLSGKVTGVTTIALVE
jgi:hypothetical protein